MEADTWLVPLSWFKDGHPKGNSTTPPEAPAFTDESAKPNDKPVLCVGHTPLDLKKENTLKRIYLDPLWEILEKVNGKDKQSYTDEQDGDANESLTIKKQRGVHGKKAWDWNGIYTERGARNETFLFYIDVVRCEIQ